MNFILQLLINAAILLGMAYLLPSISIKNYTTGILVALVVAVLNITIGALIRFPVNVVTLGLISFVVHLVVTAVMIKIADKLFDDFEVKGFVPAVIIAIVMSIAAGLFNL